MTTEQLIGWSLAAFLALVAIFLGSVIYVGMREERRRSNPWDDYPQSFSMEASNANRTKGFETGAAANSGGGRARTTQVGMGEPAELDCGAADERARAAGL